jgi:hypothetical protein
LRIGLIFLVGKKQKSLDKLYHIVAQRMLLLYPKGGDVVEMDMQDSAEMCCAMSKFNKLLRKQKWKGRADLGRL